MTMKDLPVIPVYTDGDDSVNATVNAGKNPDTYALDVPDANTQYSHTFPVGTTRFMLRLAIGELTYGYSDGELNFYVGKNGGLESPPIDPTSSVTLYFKSSKNSDTLHVETWQ